LKVMWMSLPSFKRRCITSKSSAGLASTILSGLAIGVSGEFEILWMT
jgi:hypothetical protein